MFHYTAFNPEGEALVHIPVDLMEGEVFKTGVVDSLCLMYKGYYLGRVENFSVRSLAAGDMLHMKLDGGGHTMLASMGNVLRWRDVRPGELFILIYQLRLHLGGTETRKPIHLKRPQTYTPPGPVPDEEPQRVRWWYPRRLVQWLKT